MHTALGVWALDATSGYSSRYWGNVNYKQCEMCRLQSTCVSVCAEHSWLPLPVPASEGATGSGWLILG